MQSRPLLLFLLVVPGLSAQRNTGELRLTVRDAGGLPLPARIELASQATQVQQTVETSAEGAAALKAIPFGVYRLTVVREQFASWSKTVEIRSELPVELSVVLGLAETETTVVVRESETLLDPYRTGTVNYVGRQNIRERRAAMPSRAVLELVESQPGWLLEANGVLHPRGSEYNTQYIIDGIPVADNRSPAFAPPLDAEDLESMRVLTANYPAEYGRKLGGVVEATTARESRRGLHGKTAVQAASFDTLSGFASLQYLKGRNAATLNAEAFQTGRFLDAPVEENFTNHGFLGGFSGRFERDLTDRDRLRFYTHARQTGFLVPNEALQQRAGQRQDRRSDEAMGQVSYQRVLSPLSIANVRFMARDVGAQLWSNPLATPILAGQDRGFREAYLNGSVAFHAGAHEWKTGAEWIRASVRESFAYRITDSQFFDSDVPGRFGFSGYGGTRESSAYVQDLVRWRNWTLSAGLRLDRYRFLVRDTALSPRLGIAWHWPGAGMVLHASYDRAFEVPAIENLLLASSREAQSLTKGTTGLPVPPSRGNFYQVGFAKTLGSRARLDGNWFHRRISDFADDALLLNTGISFPISFARAEIHGFEGKLEIPAWGRFSGFVSYANLVGTGFLPVTGGLFLEEEVEQLLRSTSSFPVTQDQRNTLQGRMRVQVAPRLWSALSYRYGSGLPVERDEGVIDPARFSGDILARVDLERGRVLPSYFVDLAAGADILSRERMTARLQFDMTNVADRLNLINFAGAFSGTALAAPRAWSLRLVTEF